MMTSTKNNTQRTTAVINTALSLLSDNAVRLHKDTTLPTVNFRDQASTEARYNIKDDNFRTVVNTIYDAKKNFSNEFSVSITGLIALAIAINSTSNDITLSEVQANGHASDEWFRHWGFSDNTTNLVEYAFYPWTKLDNGVSTDEAAAANYQRRLRTSDGQCSDNQTAYRNLARQILLNMRNNDGEFVPSRDDYRAVNRNA
jgi:hypothetical protein